MNYKYQIGTTLMELLLVVSIIGILASIAIPGFQSFIMQSRRDDAHHLIMLNAQRLQRCFTLEGLYTGSCGTRSESERGYYKLSDDSQITENTFTLIVSPVDGTSQKNDSNCQAFMYEHTGKRSAIGADPTSCW